MTYAWLSILAVVAVLGTFALALFLGGRAYPEHDDTRDANGGDE